MKIFAHFLFSGKLALCLVSTLSLVPKNSKKSKLFKFCTQAIPKCGPQYKSNCTSVSHEVIKQCETCVTELQQWNRSTQQRDKLKYCGQKNPIHLRVKTAFRRMCVRVCMCMCMCSCFEGSGSASFSQDASDPSFSPLVLSVSLFPVHNILQWLSRHVQLHVVHEDLCHL